MTTSELIKKIKDLPPLTQNEIIQIFRALKKHSGFCINWRCFNLAEPNRVSCAKDLEVSRKIAKKQYLKRKNNP